MRKTKVIGKPCEGKPHARFDEGAVDGSPLPYSTDFYERYRAEFSTFDEFVDWYNCIRPHESLAPNGLKTPEEAFWERLPEGAFGSEEVMEVVRVEVIG